MALVVLLRAVNVGGSKRFKPSTLPDELPELSMTNIGAAGTYVVQAEVAEAEARDAVERGLPFETEVLVLDGAELRELVDQPPFGAEGQTEGVKRSVTVLAADPAEPPALPVDRPEHGPWQLRLVTRRGRMVFSMRRPEVDGRFYPNAVVEKLYGAPATTRGWSTIEHIGRVLAEQSTA